MSGFGIGVIDIDEDGLLDDYDAIPLDWTPDEDDPEDATQPPPPPEDPYWNVITEPDQPPIVGGINLVPNSSFEQVGEWSAGNGWTMPYRAQEVSPFHGSAVAYCAARGGVGDLRSPLIAVDVSKPHWLSVESWMVDLVTGSGRVVVEEYEADGTPGKVTVAFDIRGEQASWVRLQRSFVSRMRLNTDVAWDPYTTHVRILIQTVDAPTLDWWVDGLQLEEGTVQSVYEPRPGEDIDGSEIIPGTLPPETFDVTPPAVPGITAVRSAAQTAQDGTTLVILTATFSLPTDPDYAGIEAEATQTFVRSDPADPLSPPIPVWTPRLFDFLPAGDTDASFAVTAVTHWWVRGRSIDTQGNRSEYSAVVETDTVGDGEAPAIPEGLDVFGVYRGIVASWNRAKEYDLAYSEVRYRMTVNDGVTVDPVPEWGDPFRTRSTMVTIEPLEATEDDAGLPTTTYEVAVRHVDTSGQVQTASDNPIPIDAGVDPLAGWSVSVAAQPTLVAGGDIKAYSITAAQIKAGEIRADMVAAGMMTINTTDDLAHADGIHVVAGVGDNAPELARWDDQGLIDLGGGRGDRLVSQPVRRRAQGRQGQRRACGHHDRGDRRDAHQLRRP